MDPTAPDYTYSQPKFIVFCEILLKFFLLFCFNCKAENPQVTMRQNGTMVPVKQQCSKCKGLVWNSQSYMPHSKYPAGNMLPSLAVLMAGASISKVLLLFHHLDCAATHHVPSSHTRGHSFSLLSSASGSCTEMALLISLRTWKMWYGPEMGDSTPWDTQPSMELTQCSLQASWKWCILNLFRYESHWLHVIVLV